MHNRRRFVGSMLGGAAVLVTRGAMGQQTAQTMTGPMEQDAYRPVKLAPTSTATPVMNAEQRDDLEHQIRCQCGCVLDVYTCRTTDFSCAVSPAMHADVLGLVAGGHAAKEILAAFQSVYGERVLMAPLRQGFNLVGYAMPFAVVLTGGALAAAMIRRWKKRGQQPTLAAPAGDGIGKVEATPAELEELALALRDDR